MCFKNTIFKVCQLPSSNSRLILLIKLIAEMNTLELDISLEAATLNS